MGGKIKNTSKHHIHEASRREAIVQDILQNKMSKVKAARLLNLSTKTIYRMCKRYEDEGFDGLVSRKRPGMTSNRRYKDDIREKAKAFVLSQRGRGYGPKKLAERLTKEQNLKLSSETLRVWMLEWKLWKQVRRPGRKPAQPS